MFNQELINYIKEQLRIGTPKELVKDVLMTRGGWVSADVDEAIRLATGQPKVAAPAMPQQSLPPQPAVQPTQTFSPTPIQQSPVMPATQTAALQQAPFTADGFRPAQVAAMSPTQVAPQVQPLANTVGMQAPLQSGQPFQATTPLGGGSQQMNQSAWGTAPSNFQPEVVITEKTRPGIFARILKTLFTLVILAALGAGGWYAYTKYFAPQPVTTSLSAVASAFAAGVTGGSFDMTLTQGAVNTSASGIFTKDPDTTISLSGSLRRSDDPSGAKPTAIAYTGKSTYFAIPDQTTKTGTVLGSLYNEEKFLSQKIFGTPFAVSGEYLASLSNPDLSQSLLAILTEILGRRSPDASSSFFSFVAGQNALTLGALVGEEPIAEIPTLHYKVTVDPLKAKEVLGTFVGTLPVSLRAPFLSYFDTVATMGGDIWIGKSDALPYQIVLTLMPKDVGDGKTLMPTTFSLMLKDFIQSGVEVNGKAVSIPQNTFPLADMLSVPPSEREKTAELDIKDSDSVTPEHPPADENHTAISNILLSVDARAKAYYAKNKTYVGLCLSKDTTMGLWPVILDIRAHKSKSPTCRESATAYAIAATTIEAHGGSVACVDNTTGTGYASLSAMPTTPMCK